MHAEKDYKKFFLYFNLFVFSMLALVLANNLVFTFVGWEGVGSLLLLAREFLLRSRLASSAGKKAFIYKPRRRRRTAGGDVLVVLRAPGPSPISGCSRRPVRSPHGRHPRVLALLLAATGKSAQIPLFNWLPDAMEGPRRSRR